ncbi:hypothetical protein HDU93_008798 [Gonapodya sp. JEL0774]|nr:hypothetical protein HDU93_008798 [Gonapodya sp. JEL0774]
MEDQYGSLRDHSLRSMRSVLAERGANAPTLRTLSPVTTLGRDFSTGRFWSRKRTYEEEQTAEQEDEEEEIVMEDLRDEVSAEDSDFNADTTMRVVRRTTSGISSMSARRLGLGGLLRRSPKFWIRVGTILATTQTIIVMALAGVLLALNSRLLVRAKVEYGVTNGDAGNDDLVTLEYYFLVVRLYEVIVFVATFYQLHLFLRAELALEFMQAFAGIYTKVLVQILESDVI